MRLPHTLDQLNLPRIFSTLARRGKGLTVLAGPSGSGCSCSLAAMIDDVNRHQVRHIVVLEESTEFLQQSQKSLLTQCLFPASRRRWPAAIRALSSQRPDLVALGRLGGLACLKEVLRLTAQGTPVLAVTRGDSVVPLVEKLFHSLPTRSDRANLVQHLGAVVVQHLLPGLRGGQIPAPEVLVSTPASQHLLREEKWPLLYAIMQAGARTGTQTLEQALYELTTLALIHPQEALKQARQPDQLRRLLDLSRLPS